MKSKWITGILFFLIGAVSFTSCLKDECDATQTFISYSPVYKTVDEIRQDIQILAPQNLENPGKIYYYQNYLIVNEIREGLHIIDNTDPANPVNISFVKIPGNVDIAVKNNMLYADNYIDLLTIDLSDPTSPVLQHRTEDVFSSLSQNQDLGHLVYYEQAEQTVEIDCTDPRWGSQWFKRGDNILFDASVSVTNASSSGGSSVPSIGVAGSMARFAIYNNFLYTIDNNDVDVFDITNVTLPDLEGSFNVGWGIETLFPYGDKMFIGSTSGMFIYDLEDASSPTQISQFQHARSCDPVFIKDDYAYVTLRSGTLCQGFTNQLDVVDISDLSNPFLVKSYSMSNPHGLSIRENNLYLCDGASGLKVYDIENVEDIDRTDWVKNMETFDAISIPGKEVLLVVGKDGIFQFDTSDNSDLKQISSIAVNRK